MENAMEQGGPAAPDDLLPALHEEIARLPERFRLAVVYCDLQGMSQAQAAGQLHVCERTIHHRLAERAELKAGFPNVGYPPAPRPSMPCSCASASRRAPGLARPPSAEPGITNSLDHRRGRLGGSSSTRSGGRQGHVRSEAHTGFSTLIAAGLIAGRIRRARLGHPRISEQRAASAPPLVPRKADPAAAQPLRQPLPGSADITGSLPVRGRVLDPDGKPIAGAEIFARPCDETETGLLAARQQGRVAVTDSDGRFHFNLDKSASDFASEGAPGWHLAQIAATAAGFAPSWIEARDVANTGEATFHLKRDDLPIRGRVDAQGRPVAGVSVRVRIIGVVKDNVDPDALLASGTMSEDQVASWYGFRLLGPPGEQIPPSLWPAGWNTWTTDEKGQFEITGVGRDRIARLSLHGGGVADGTIDVLVRTTKTPRNPKPRPCIIGLTVPPGHGFITAVAAVSAKDDPFAVAHGRFPGFPVIPPVAAFHAVQSVDVPAGPQPFVVDLVLTRGTDSQGTLVGPTRKPVTGVCSFGLTSLATTSVQKLETGSFVVHGLRPGSPRHALSAHEDLRLAGSALLQNDDIKSNERLVVRMECSGAAKGRLVDEDGQPLSVREAQSVDLMARRNSPALDRPRSCLA